MASTSFCVIHNISHPGWHCPQCFPERREIKERVVNDVEKCVGGCSKKLLCERYTMPHSGKGQRYGNFHPDTETGLCMDWMANKVALAPDEDDHLKNHNQD